MKKLGPTVVPSAGAEVMLDHQKRYLLACPSRKVVKTRRVEFQRRMLPSGRLAAKKPDHVILMLECGHEVTHLAEYRTVPGEARCISCGPQRPHW